LRSRQRLADDPLEFLALGKSRLDPAVLDRAQGSRHDRAFRKSALDQLPPADRQARRLPGADFRRAIRLAREQQAIDGAFAPQAIGELLWFCRSLGRSRTSEPIARLVLQPLARADVVGDVRIARQ
jgi:hypothetical protein